MSPATGTARGSRDAGAALLEQCHLRRDGRYADIGVLVDRLREVGWSDERLVKNDLIEPRGVAGRAWDHAAFWNTIARLTHEFEALGLPPIFIKCVRDYPYCDSNVDVLVPRSELRPVARKLWSGAWLAPETWDAFEQLLIERAKLKLPSREEGLITAHLYGGVSWRYQSDIGLLRLDGREANPDHLQRVTIGDCVPSSAAARVPEADLPIWIPSDASELVLQAAHVAYENFRITVGEALHFRLVALRSPAALDEARGLAAEYGCGDAVDLLDDESRKVVDRLLTLDPSDYPRTFPADALGPAFRDRANFLNGRGQWLSAAHERATMHLVFRLVSVIRRRRRARRGAEDYRH